MGDVSFFCDVVWYDLCVAKTMELNADIDPRKNVRPRADSRIVIGESRNRGKSRLQTHTRHVRQAMYRAILTRTPFLFSAENK